MSLSDQAIPGSEIVSADNQPGAGFWVRLAAILIDRLVIASVFLLLMILLRLFYPTISSEVFLQMVIFAALPMILLIDLSYLTYFNARGKQTVGKRIFGLIVVDKNSNPISLAKSAVRSIILELDAFIGLLGHLLILLTAGKQAINDIFSRSYVIYKAAAPPASNRRIIAGIFGSVALLLLMALVTRESFIKSYSVPSHSMTPTILAGEYIMVDKIWGKSPQPQAGDIVVFQLTDRPGYDYLKRVIAVGGQTLEIRNDTVFVDGLPEGGQQFIATIPESESGLPVNEIQITNPAGKQYTIRHFANNRSHVSKKFDQVRIPGDHVFVMGDNRHNSADSRHWGFIPLENIQGKAGLIWWSYDGRVRWERIGKPLR